MAVIPLLPELVEIVQTHPEHTITPFVLPTKISLVSRTQTVELIVIMDASLMLPPSVVILTKQTLPLTQRQLHQLLHILTIYGAESLGLGYSVPGQ